MSDFSRRELLLASAGLTGSALAGAARAGPALPIDLTDPATALQAYVKLRGSTAAETVFQAYEGDLFMVTEGRAPSPAVGFKGIQKSHWSPHPEGGYRNRDFDVGVYVDYRTREVLSYWDNPLTGKEVEVIHYRGGPSGGHFRVSGDAGDAYGGLAGRWSVVGDQLWHTSSRWGERPNPLPPSEWPEASSSDTIVGSMSLSFSGRVAEVRDPAMHQVPAMQVWTNVSSWMPWMEMGRQAGFNMWRWVGAKGVRRENLDPELVAAVETIWPGYVTRDAVWEVPTSGRHDYARVKRGEPQTQ